MKTSILCVIIMGLITIGLLTIHFPISHAGVPASLATNVLAPSTEQVMSVDELASCLGGACNKHDCPWVCNSPDMGCGNGSAASCNNTSCSDHIYCYTGRTYFPRKNCVGGGTVYDGLCGSESTVNCYQQFHCYCEDPWFSSPHCACQANFPGTDDIRVKSGC